MKITPKTISVNQNSMKTGCMSIDDTGENVKNILRELSEVNDLFQAELSGDVGNNFSGARKELEDNMENISKTFLMLSEEIKHYITENISINKNADILAGGKVK